MSDDRNPTPPNTRPLHIRRWRDGASHVIELIGELDAVNAPDLRAEISSLLHEPSPPDLIEVDLAAVPFLDSLGLGTLVIGHRICAEVGVRLTVRNPSPYVTRVLDVSGFREHLMPAP